MIPVPQVPAALCGLYIGGRVTSDAYGRRVVGRATGFSEDAAFVAVDFEPSGFGTLPVAETFLLLDSPLAMCHAARWLATRLGMDPGVTAPLWYRVADPEGDGCWFLKSYTESGEVHAHGFRIASTTDPAEALAAACVAVGGAS